MFLPDPDAEFPAYERMGLTRKEFDEFKKLGKYSRTFLIKQGNQSAFVKLDLHGFEDEIAVLSGDRENVLILDEVRAEVGDDPDIWLPVYLERVFAARLRAQLIQRHGPDDPEWKPRARCCCSRKAGCVESDLPAGSREGDGWRICLSKIHEGAMMHGVANPQVELLGRVPFSIAHWCRL